MQNAKATLKAKKLFITDQKCEKYTNCGNRSLFHLPTVSAMQRVVSLKTGARNGQRRICGKLDTVRGSASPPPPRQNQGGKRRGAVNNFPKIEQNFVSFSKFGNQKSAQIKIKKKTCEQGFFITTFFGTFSLNHFLKY